MHKVMIRAIGSAQESWQKQAVLMYLERLRPFFSVDIVELAEGHRGSTKPDIEKTKTIEAQTLLKSIPDDAYVIALDETGKQINSFAFSEKLNSWLAESSCVVFLVGGSWGLGDEAKQRADLLFSVGSMTLPHALARIVLLEQLYRAGMIRAGKKYHK